MTIIKNNIIIKVLYSAPSATAAQSAYNCNIKIY